MKKPRGLRESEPLSPGTRSLKAFFHRRSVLSYKFPSYYLDLGNIVNCT